jgi:hypothetical protein
MEDMLEPPARSLPTETDAVMCIASHVSFQEEPPFQVRRGMTTIRPQLVDRFGAARLYCDCLHDGPHEWPHAYLSILTRT